VRGLRSRRLAALAAAALVFPASASALQPPPDLRDARYCEVLEMRGELPDARIYVWNTIAFSDCPQAKFERLDPATIAAQTGASLVVINGPRHFLMDSAEARIGSRVRIFGGMRMRRVATIPVAEPADLVQGIYAERTINRVNTWTWERGRRVFELIDPEGTTYVMQSYSLMRDPELELADLRRLGSRLELPEGWRYRTRRLREDLTLGAEGTATIIQDDLNNTYQRATARLVP
jgi:hypothetical protein